MPSGISVNQLRLVGVSGTNKVMAGEMSRLAGRVALPAKLPAPKKDGLGALTYPFEPHAAALAVRHHRTSIRVLWDLYESPAQRLEPLYEDVLALVKSDDRGWIQPGLRISVDARRMEEFAAGERQIVGTVKNALIDGAAARGAAMHVDAESPDVLFDIRLRSGAVAVSIDLAGRPMHQRGYRQAGGVAPLKENLAAVLVMLGRHQARTEALVDPMCGSGTIAIEAACMGLASPVFLPTRTPACEVLAPMREACSTVPEPLFGDTRPLILANEVNEEAFVSTKDHAKRAGVGEWVHTTHGDFRDLSTSSVAKHCRARGFDAGHGLILSNPPYGERIDTPELLTLYRDLGRWCRQFRGWRAAFLVANPDFERVFGGRARIKKPLSNGPIRSTFLMYDL